MSKYYLGIDLGISGAISLMSDNKGLIICEPLPTVSVMVGKKMRNQYDVVAINEMFRAWVSDYNIVGAIAENLRAFPGQSSQTGFSLGKSAMLFKVLCTIYKISYLTTEPVKWQKEIFSSQGIQYDGKTTKQASILAAKQLFPGFNFKKTDRCKKDDHNMTDSACLVEYLRRISK